MADLSSFIGGFGGGFAQGVEQRRLRELFQAEQEQAERDRELSERRIRVQEEGLGIRGQQFELEQDRFGLERERLNVQQQQFEEQQAVRERSQSLEEKKHELELRKQDLQISKTLTEQLLNPKIPKPLRKRIIQQWAPALGMDRQSQEYKDFEAMMLSLDEDGMQELKSAFTSIMPDAPPGQITGLARLIARGDLPVTEALEIMQQGAIGRLRQGGQTQTAAPAAPAPTAPPTPAALRDQALATLRDAARLANAGDEEGARLRRAEATELRQMASDMERGLEFDPAEVERRAVAEQTGKRRAANQAPLPNSISDLIGFGDGITQGDAKQMGVFTDMLGPDEVKELRKRKANVQNALKSVDDLAKMIEGRPELLGPAGAVSRGLSAAVSAIEGLGVAAGGLLNLDMGSVRNNETVRRALDSEVAETSAVVKSRLTDLAFQIATAREAGRLSNQDYERALSTLGQSPNPELFTRVLRDLGGRLREAASSDIEAMTGIPPLDLQTSNELAAMAEGVDDPRVLRFILKELTRRTNGR